MKKTIKTIAVIFLLSLLPALSNAQAPDPGSDNGTNGGTTPSGSGTGGGAPIDGGMSIFVILALGYASSKVIQLKEITAQE